MTIVRQYKCNICERYLLEDETIGLDVNIHDPFRIHATEKPRQSEVHVCKLCLGAMRDLANEVVGKQPCESLS